MSAPDTVHVTIEPTTIRGERGQHYRVHHAGEVLIEDCWNPEYDAARALLAKGVTGKVEVWRGDQHASTIDVEVAAGLTVVENANSGPRLAPWVPFSPYGHQTAVSSYTVAPPAAVSRGRRAMEYADEDGRW